jgi:uncharacterized membrane protein
MNLNRKIDKADRQTRFIAVMCFVGVFSFAANYANYMGNMLLALIFLGCMIVPTIWRAVYIHTKE